MVKKNIHHIFLKFLDMICLAINYHIVMKTPAIFALKFDYFDTELFILRSSV